MRFINLASIPTNVVIPASDISVSADPTAVGVRAECACSECACSDRGSLRVYFAIINSLLNPLVSELYVVFSLSCEYLWTYA